ncbi:nose resistant to fluoxetine protein 6-like [Trichoplusia ni]|uniref:Nose resistant to fluoxetine protein 6-like n=1 Tax=Trichoplusia ni TaxID=7111 RepID=A0A7E5WFZ5_TRINI|nr:nose resistant to fluoxetine protein 6-like [Trichoplusia ni]
MESTMMRLSVLLIILLEGSSAVIYKLNVSEYKKMPPLYAMDDYEACMADTGGTYCLVDFNLRAGKNPDLMSMIQGYSDYKMKHFNHTQIHRGVCLTITCKDYRVPNANGTEALQESLEGCLNNSIFLQYGLEGSIDNINYCDREGETIPIDTGDIVMAVVYLLIIVLNVAGSCYDVLLFNKEDKTGNPYLMAFSLRRNWARLTAPAYNEDQDPRLERLKLFHGLRTMTMLCVFFSHTVLIMSYSYVDNPLYIENAYEDPLKQILFNGTLVTHTFFVMSAFLLAYNFQMHAEKHAVSWLQFPKGILLRCLRLSPVYALMLLSVSTWLRRAGGGPLWARLVRGEAAACRQYWWAQLLYLNNYVYGDALCLPQTWYLAADTQLFCLGLAVCLLARSGRGRALLLGGLFAAAIAIVAGHTYFQDLDPVVIQSPEKYRNMYATDPTFRLLYIRGHTNMSTYILGLAGGFLAYHLHGKDMQKYKRKFRVLVWLVFPAGLAIILSGGMFYGSWRAPAAARLLYAALYKPAFQTVIITLILGCIFKIETVYRGLVEWRGWAWSGRVSYSAFFIHTQFQRALVGAQLQPLHMTDYYVMMILAGTIFLTYLCACAAWLLLEAPAAGVVRAVLNRTDRQTGQHDTKV